MEVDLSFGQQAVRLEREGRGEEALHLLEAGVVAHPWYATGHYLLGRRYLAESRWPEARLELERALQLEGSYPASLEALAVCYERLGLGDLARGCRALGRDLDPRPLTSAEEGLEMTDEPTREPEGAVGPEDTGEERSPEDALAELEALLQGASDGLEGSAAAEEPDEGPAIEVGSSDELLAFEPEALPPEEIPEMETVEAASGTGTSEETDGIEPEAPGGDEVLDAGSIEDAPGPGTGARETMDSMDTSEMSEEEKAALWKKILEQAEGAGETRVEEAVEEVGGEDLEEVGAGIEETAGEDKEDLWKKILEQAEQIEGAEEVTEVDPGEPETAALEIDAGSLDIDTGEVTGSGIDVEPVELEGVSTGEGEVEVAPLEGLEVSTPGGMADYEEVAAQEQSEEPALDTEGEEPAAPAMEEPEAVETPADVLSELEQTLEGLEPTGIAAAEEWSVGGLDGPAGQEESGPEEAVPVLDGMDEEAGSPEDALKALEAELAGETPDAAATEEPEAPVIEDSLDTLESLEAIEDLETTGIGGLEEVPEPPQEEAEEEEPVAAEQVAAPAADGRIVTSDDAIRQAIKADILAAQGKKEEAGRIFEALLLWDPDRAAFKESLESLRRTE